MNTRKISLIMLKLLHIAPVIGAAGMLVFIALAVLMTPLDRYVTLVFAKRHIAAYVLALIMGAVFLLISTIWRKKVEG